MSEKKVVFLMVLMLSLFFSFPSLFAWSPHTEIDLAWGFYVQFSPEDDCETHLKLLIQNAQKSIHCAFYEIELDSIAQELVRSQKAGKDVKIVVDDKMAEEPESKVSYLITNGVEVKKDSSKSYFMHNKFCVIDGTIVWTGSLNPTYSGTKTHNNNVVVINSALLGENYETEFEEMWEGKFGKTSPKNTPYPQLVVSGKQIECYFGPEDEIAEEILTELNNAKENIYFMAFSFTRDDMSDVIICKHREGKEVRGVFESMASFDETLLGLYPGEYSKYWDMKDAGLNVRLDGNPDLMHHKVFIVDNLTVITGSPNFSNRGVQDNDENLLIIHDPETASHFLREFEEVWQEAQQNVNTFYSKRL
jgi:phosphatidylserine/phosphatidylglycerophosphate/cardiolipin synthase-like enzyme